MEAIEAGKHVVTANKALLAVHGTEIFAAAHRQGRDGGLRGGGGRRHPDHQGAARRPHGQQHRVDRRHHQRHHQLHPVRDARQGPGLRRRAEGGAAPGLCRGRPHLRHRRRGRRAQGDHHVAPSPSASRCSSTRPMSKASPSWPRRTSATPSSWATASSCWASPSARAKGIELRVHPALVPAKRLIANVEGAMNAVVVQGDAVGTTLYYGKGAGSEPTASAVIADLVDITRLHTADAAHRVPHLAFQPDAMSDAAGAADERGRDQLLPAPARGRPGRRAGQGHRACWPTPASASTPCCSAKPARARRLTQTDLIILTHSVREGTMNEVIAQMQAPAHGAGADRAHPQGRTAA